MWRRPSLIRKDLGRTPYDLCLTWPAIFLPRVMALSSSPGARGPVFVSTTKDSGSLISSIPEPLITAWMVFAAPPSDPSRRVSKAKPRVSGIMSASIHFRSLLKWPVVFPLSNPTSIAEALPEDIFAWTDGRAIVATGSPFEDVVHAGRTYPIGQGNNAFIFPGLGFASILSEASRITDGMVLESAYALADYTAAGHVEAGRVYPPIRELPEVSIRVTTRVMARAIEEGVARKEGLEGRDLDTYVRQHFWRPRHLPFVRGVEPS